MQKTKSEFTKNVVTLMTGTAVAQAIPIAISPILTRIYTPEDFGVFALFVAIISILGNIANARYELAIMLPKKDEDAINIFALGFIITCVISLSILSLVFMFNDYFTELLGNKEIGFWLYFVPLAVFFSGLWNILNYFNNRKKNYKDLRNATILKSIVLAIVQLSVGFIKNGASGLISGQLLSNMFANMKLLKNILKNKLLLSKISLVKIIALAKKYRNFPKYSLMGSILNTLTQHLTSILISVFYNTSTLGFYSIAQKILGMPSTLLGNSIGQVFFLQASKEKQSTGRAVNSFKNILKKLIIFGFPPFFILYFISEDLFSFVFGSEWIIAGTYTKILVPLFFINFVVGTISPIDTIMEKQKIYLFFNLVLLIGVVLVIFFLRNSTFEIFLNYYVIVVSFIYLIYGYILYLMSQAKL